LILFKTVFFVSIDFFDTLIFFARNSEVTPLICFSLAGYISNNIISSAIDNAYAKDIGDWDKVSVQYAYSDFSNSSGKVLRFLKLQAAANANFLDATITGDTSNAKALVDEVDSDRLYFHQTEDTGFKAFQEGEAITGGGQSGTLIAAGVDVDSDAFTRDDVNKLSGQILYIENRAPVTRSANQTEDIKVVITL